MLDRQLTHVVAVARTGSFTKAAERVGITQSGITRSIADLERDLGYALFFRTARGAMLTEQGRDFVERAGQLLEDARTLLSSSGEQGDPFARTIRIGVCPSSLEWRLADPLAELLSQHPTTRFQVVGSSLERLAQLLRSGAVDVAVGLEDAFVEWGDIKSERISEVRGVLFVRKHHPLLSGAKISRIDLARFDCILPSDSRPFRNVLLGLYEEAGIPWQRHLHVTDSVAIAKRLVATSEAFALTSEEAAGSASFAQEFDRIPLEDLPLIFPLCCATRARWELSRPVIAFLHVMKNIAPRIHDPFS